MESVIATVSDLWPSTWWHFEVGAEFPCEVCEDESPAGDDESLLLGNS